MHFTFETYRLIQCKRPLLAELEYNYRWSGSISPKISSENQRIEEQACRTDDNYHTAIIKFKKPLTFNESAVLHKKQAMMTQKEMLSRPDAGYYYRIDWEK